jgi:hypothetical protein
VGGIESTMRAFLRTGWGKPQEVCRLWPVYRISGVYMLIVSAAPACMACGELCSWVLTSLYQLKRFWICNRMIIYNEVELVGERGGHVFKVTSWCIYRKTEENHVGFHFWCSMFQRVFEICTFCMHVTTLFVFIRGNYLHCGHPCFYNRSQN